MIAHIPEAEWGDMLLPRGTSGGIVMLYVRGYFDDAGTHRDSDVVVIGGLYGVRQQWRKFENAWAAMLATPLPEAKKPALKAFHLSDCAGRWPKSEFANYSNAEQDAVIHDFRQIIIDCELISVACAIDKKAWDDLVVGPYRAVLGGAINHCFIRCVQDMLETLSHTTRDHSVAVMLDKGIYAPFIQGVADAFEREKLVSVSFGRVEKFLPLQGADIVATENYWFAAQWLKLRDAAMPRPHLRHYLDHMLHQGFILDRAAIEGEIRQRRPDGHAP